MMFAHRAPWESIPARQYISLASLICVSWEHLLTIQHEYTHVWKSRFTVTKWLYLCLRYGGLSLQFANHIISARLLSNPPITSQVCAFWFAFQSAYVQVLITLFELILLVRVWALFNQSSKVAVGLSIGYICELVIMAYTGVRTNLAFNFDETCLIDKTPKEAYGVVVAPIVMQVVIWTMTLYKQSLSRREREHSPHILNLVFRDGLIVFMIISAVFGCSLSYSVLVHDLTHSMWSILATIVTITGCRIIMNMQKLKIPRLVSSEIELTTFIASGTHFVATGFSPTYFDGPDDEDYEFGQTRAEHAA